MSVIYDALKKVQRERAELGRSVKVDNMAFHRGFQHTLSFSWYLSVLIVVSIIVLFIGYKINRSQLEEKGQRLFATSDILRDAADDLGREDVREGNKREQGVEAAVRHNLQGMKLYNDFRFSDAIAEFRKAISLKPAYPEAYNNLGIVSKGMGDIKTALKYYNEALRFRPDYPEALNNAGVALDRLGRHDEAESRFLKAIQLLPSYHDPYLNLAISLDSSGKTFEALRYYEAFLLKYQGEDDRLLEEIDNRIVRIRALSIEQF
ncbi:MAG: tetratricopeptide repeat protein [Thermodesulfobacteriota bacterium]